MTPKKWLNKKFRELRKQFGGKCSNPECNATTNLQFAHIKETKLNGQGRGKKKRYYDIKNNPESYILLCNSCHWAYDKDNKQWHFKQRIYNQ